MSKRFVRIAVAAVVSVAISAVLEEHYGWGHLPADQIALFCGLVVWYLIFKRQEKESH